MADITMLLGPGRQLSFASDSQGLKNADSGAVQVPGITNNQSEVVVDGSRGQQAFRHRQRRFSGPVVPVSRPQRSAMARVSH
jgi:hypothetical protein